MQKIYMNELPKYLNQEITIEGFVDNIRDLQWVAFLIIRDSFGKVQVTIEKSEEKNQPLIELIHELTLESTVKITGKLLENPKVKLNGMEFIPNNIEITSLSLPNLPIDIKDKEKSLRETRLDYRFLDLRREDNNLLFKVETLFEHSLREYCMEHNFTEIHTPKICAQAAESGAAVFKLDYFGEPATLSQSPQFYKQMALAAGFDKVLEIGQAFRAENSHTSYHATEINMIDIEIAWINNVNEVMDFEEAWLKYAIGKVNEKYGENIKKMFNTELTNTEVDFPRITFAEAKKIIKENYQYEAEIKDDFERKEEELISKYAKEKYNSDFIFITNYPYAARPFYHMLEPDGTTKSYDLIYRGLEITTGAKREHRYDILTKQIKEKGINPKDLEFYTEFFKYGCPPHGGFAIGTSRVMMKLLNIDNIREATFIYRGPTRLKP